DAFGVRKIGSCYERAPERDREQHPEHPSAHADEERLPEREPSPPTHDHQSRQHKDDRGERAGCGGYGLDNVIFENRRISYDAENGHGDHRGGDRRGEGEAELEAEIDISGREDGSDGRAKNQTADGELSWFHGQ